MDLHRRIAGSPVPRAEALLGLPGVLRPAQADETVGDTGAVAAGFADALAALVAARQAEGARLGRNARAACWTRSPRCIARPQPRRPISPPRSVPG